MIYDLVNKGVNNITIEFTPEEVCDIKILMLESKKFFHFHAQQAVNKFVVTKARVLSFEPTSNELIFKLFYE